MKSEDKPVLHDLIRNDPKTPEGKYLVKRRDGTIPEWPSFVIGAKDPNATAALLAYADEGERNGSIHVDFAASIRKMAYDFDDYRSQHGDGDPGRGIHRKDDPATIAEMKHGRSA